MEFDKYIFSRGLPKTGQVTEYVAGDDGTYENGWWLKRLNANNRTRFISKTIDGDVIVYDRATGLCWAADGHEAGCNNNSVITWANAITYANGLDFAGFTDWRLPNINELLSILNYALVNPPLLEPPFSNTEYGSYWTSTTYSENALQAWRVIFIAPKTDLYLKTESVRIRCVRTGF